MSIYSLMNPNDIVSSFQLEDGLLVKSDELFDTVEVSKCNIKAAFVGDEFDKNLVSKVADHVICADREDKEDDIFHVTLPESYKKFKVVEYITIGPNDANLLAAVKVNKLDIILYEINVEGNKRRFEFQGEVVEDDISGSELSALEFKHEVLDLLAKRLSDMWEFSPDIFRTIEFLNGDRVEIDSCIEYDGGELCCRRFFKADIENRKCTFGVEYFNKSKGMYEPCLKFHSKW